MRRMHIIAMTLAAAVLIMFPAPAPAQSESAGEILRRLDELQRDVRAALAPQQLLSPHDPPAGLSTLAGPDAEAEAGAEIPDGPLWRPLAPDESLPAQIVLLIHGLDEPGDIWDTLAPRLGAAGHTVVRFEYPNDQPISASTDELIEAMADLRARGVEDVDIVAHSMGGLIARDALTRPADAASPDRPRAPELPAAGRLIMLGVPNHGSPWARLRALAEIREQAMRFADDPDPGRLLAFLRDGTGEAGTDLMPGSDYLRQLNRRPLPQIPITLVIGRLAPQAPGEAAAQLTRWLGPDGLAASLLGAGDVAAVREALELVTSSVGDGVVPVESALLAGVDDVVYVEANHRGMIHTVDMEQAAREAVGLRRVEDPPALKIVLDRLGDD